MNKRQYIGIVASLFSIVGTENLKSEADLPKLIEGARTVETYGNENYPNHLIHIRQKHKIPIKDLKKYARDRNCELPQVVEEINSIQENIYLILKDLSPNLNEIRDEGLLVEIYDRIRNEESVIPFDMRMRLFYLRNYAKDLIDLTDADAFERSDVDAYLNGLSAEIMLEGLSDNTLKGIRKKFEKERDEMRDNIDDYDSFRFIPGGIDLLIIEGKVKPLPSETYRTRIKSNEIIKSKKSARNSITFDAREDDLLNIAFGSNQGRQNTVGVVYGGAHAWGGRETCGETFSLDGRVSFRDNLAIWNRENPGKEIYLTEITPNMYEGARRLNIGSKDN